MIKVYVLLVMVGKTPFIGAARVDANTLVFKTADACLASEALNKAELSKKYDLVYTECQSREIND